MDFLILLLAGIVVYYLYNVLQDYLKNPLNQEEYLKGRAGSIKDEIPQDEIKQDPYENIEVKSEETKEVVKQGFGNTELGVMLEILKRMPNKEKISVAFDIVIKNLINQYFFVYPNLEKDKQEALNFFNETISNRELKELVAEFFQYSYAEYKKRLRFVDFLLMIAYLDGEFEDKEREYIKSIVSGLELKKEDVDLLYELYENAFKAEISNQNEELGSDTIEESVVKNQINIFDPRNSSKNLTKSAIEISKSIKILS
ncbi:MULTISPECIES: TerB family tellurite resistance protein [unclassified Helicobacter]|uniref:TerB family tellurite resistance protein n=1 Tax=unclassified Helicobacter TaxID=2593540 RepID=UPI000CF0281B|nr:MULTISPECIES: TerB family tellurite resistance protein [unclassified Helicobacter]